MERMSGLDVEGGGVKELGLLAPRGLVQGLSPPWWHVVKML